MTIDSPTLTVAVAQFAPNDDPERNIATIRGLAEHASQRGAQLIVFPEYSSYFRSELDESFAGRAQNLRGVFVSALGEIAKTFGLCIVSGMIETSEDSSRFFNTTTAVSPTGELVARYRKQHLYDAFGQRESDWVIPGPLENPQVFQVGGLTIGLQTCYDLRFPETTRRLVDAGAELVLVPAAWVPGPHKEHHWRTLIMARAIENTIYVVAADHAPPNGIGNSMIVDPLGVVLVTIADAQDVAAAQISGRQIADVRQRNPALALRRFRIVADAYPEPP